MTDNPTPAPSAPKLRYALLRAREVPGIDRIDVYEQHGGYQALRKVIQDGISPQQVTDIVKASGLRGRGGAGFPTGVKWGFIDKKIWPHYVTVNADESEPGTFKDRELMETNPHQVIEGALLCSYAIGAELCFHYLRGEFKQPGTVTFERALQEAYQRGYLGKNILGSNYSLDMYVHYGAGAYICGEETALLESLEGKIGMPRLRPPFPAVYGLYGKPTVINNTETLANVPLIVLNGADWYRQYGTEKSPGPKVFCLSGHVKRPGNYEAELGKVTFRDLIFGEEYGQGLSRAGATVKGILPAGASAPILPESKLDTPLDYEAVAAAGSMLGSASVIVMDDSVDMVWAARKMVRFFKHESCGKCTPCREGTFWLLRVYDRIVRGEGTQVDVDTLFNVATQMTGKCFCALGEFATSPVLSSIKLFKADYDALAGGKKTAAPAKGTAQQSPAQATKAAQSRGTNPAAAKKTPEKTGESQLDKSQS